MALTEHEMRELYDLDYRRKCDIEDDTRRAVADKYGQDMAYSVYTHLVGPNTWDDLPEQVTQHNPSRTEKVQGVRAAHRSLMNYYKNGTLCTNEGLVKEMVWGPMSHIFWLLVERAEQAHEDKVRLNTSMHLYMHSKFCEHLERYFPSGLEVPSPYP